MAVFDTLDLIDAHRPGGGRSERRYYDFAISGRPLRAMVDVGDYVGVFGWLERGHEARFAAQLLLRAPSELASGRVPLYICPECGDLATGFVERTRSVQASRRSSSGEADRPRS